MFDVCSTAMEGFLMWSEDYFSDIKSVVRKLLLPDFDLPLRADIKAGINWNECN
jgi:hypothetical protein